MPLPRQLPRQVKDDIPWYPDWVIDAACRNYDPEMFFDLGSTGKHSKEKVLAAKRVCWSCPVIRLCLRDNIAVPYGIFGGLTPEERLKALGFRPELKNYRNAFPTFVRHYSRLARELREANRKAKSPKSASE